MWNNRLLLLLSVLSAAVYAVFPAIDHLGRNFPVYIILFALAFCTYLAAWYIVRDDTSDRTGLIIGIIAVICYLLLVPTFPGLSDDIYRYVWEGKVQRLGFNPFSVPPDAPALEAYRDAVWPLVTFRHMGTIYPPFAQLWFRLTGAIHYSLWFFKLSLLPFFLLTVYGVRELLKHHGKNPNLAVLFAWNPLVIIETASSGHLDIIGTALLVLALLLHYRKRDSAGAVVLAMAVCTKFLPLIALPFIWARTGRRWRYAAVFVLTCILLYVPFLDAGTALFTSLGTYTGHWFFNASVFRIFTALGGARDVYTVMAALLMLAAATWLLYRRYSIEVSVAVLLGCVYLLSPVVFPWYMLWIVPFAVVMRIWPALLFTGIVQLSYTVNWNYRLSGSWSEPWYTVAIQYGMLGVVTAGWFWRLKRSAGGPDDG